MDLSSVILFITAVDVSSLFFSSNTAESDDRSIVLLDSLRIPTKVVVCGFASIQSDCCEFIRGEDMFDNAGWYFELVCTQLSGFVLFSGVNLQLYAFTLELWNCVVVGTILGVGKFKLFWTVGWGDVAETFSGIDELIDLKALWLQASEDFEEDGIWLFVSVMDTFSIEELVAVFVTTGFVFFTVSVLLVEVDC